MGHTAKDITGQRFGKWLVLSRDGTRTHTKSNPALWKVRCDCGTESIVSGLDLRSGRTTGCSPCRRKAGIPAWARPKGKNHHHWKGGRTRHTNGYWQLAKSYIQDKYPGVEVKRKLFEHVVVMSHHLGRKLYKGETIHHKNGDRGDNRIENLELKVGNHGPGSSPKDLVKWAREIIRRYDS